MGFYFYRLGWLSGEVSWIQPKEKGTKPGPRSGHSTRRCVRRVSARAHATNVTGEHNQRLQLTMASAEEEVQPTSSTSIGGHHQEVRQWLPSQDMRQRRRRFAGSLGGGRSSGSYLRRLRENLRKPVWTGWQKGCSEHVASSVEPSSFRAKHLPVLPATCMPVGCP